MTTKAVKQHSPLTWVPSVYFAMGLPFVVLNLVAVLMFDDLGIDKTTIAFWTSLLTLPYTLKFIWSPLLEIYWTKRKFVVLTQAISGFCFALIVFTLGLPNFLAYTIALMGIIAFSGATHDIATDGIYLTALDKKTQSTYIGWQGAFYNMAKVLANGGLVWLAGYLISIFRAPSCSPATGWLLLSGQPIATSRAPFYAWMIIMGIIGLLLIGLSVYHYFALPATPKSKTAGQPRNFSEAMSEMGKVLLNFFRKKYIWLYVAFICCFRLTEGLVLKMVPIFLKAPASEGGLQLDNEQIGLIYGTLGTIAFIVGSILGGYFISRFGLKRVLFSLVCIFNIPFVIWFFFSAYLPQSIWVIGSGLVTEYFCYGFGFVGLTMFMMQQVAPGKHSMAHYAFASAIMNFSVMLPGMISGWLCEKLGYEQFFLVALIVAVPAFIMALFMPFAHKDNDDTSATDVIDSEIKAEETTETMI